MIRKSAVVLVAFFVVLSSGVVVAADGDPVEHGIDQIPSWHVKFTDGNLDTLESWANSTDDREVLRRHNESNTALVKAPNAAMGKTLIASILGGGLEQKSYIESVYPDIRVSNTDPVTLKDQEAVPTPDFLTRTTSSIGETGSEWSPQGIAFGDNVNESYPDEVRDVIGANNVSETGQGATVAVIDTGVNTDEGYVFGNGTRGSSVRILDASKDFIANETVGTDGMDAVEDPNGHGTWVASAIAANHSNDTFDGVAPDADILALRALNEDGSGTTGDIVAAIRYAADQDADVIAMSLGSPVYSPALTDAIEYAIDQNVTAVSIAAGNSRQTTRWLSSTADAPIPGVTAVTATNTTAANSSGVAYFANVGPDPGTTDFSGLETRGESVSVSAPGMQIWTKTPTTSDSTTDSRLSGTSMAQPWVAGVAALGVESNEEWVGNASAFNERLMETSRPMKHSPPGEAGSGMLAADHLLGNETQPDQSEILTTEAEARGLFWKGLGDWENWKHIEIIDGILG